MSAGKVGVHMASRNRASFKKREREMAKKQKKQDKAERMAARRAGRESEDDLKEADPNPMDEIDELMLP